MCSSPFSPFPLLQPSPLATAAQSIPPTAMPSQPSAALNRRLFPYDSRRKIESCSSLFPFVSEVQNDEQAWVDTIKSVGNGGTVRIITMDGLDQSQYLAQTVYWLSLFSAISEVVYAKHAKVHLLVAYWAHFINNTDPNLKDLLYTNIMCSSSRYNKCSGKVERKYYLVPGYNLTGPAIRKGSAIENIYPCYTRVNHGKYVVSDVRAHIGTNNLIWDYFYTTSGVSFGTYNYAIVSQLQ